VGLMISTRQVLLHITPDEPGYGSPVLGLHLYTWAGVVFLVVILVSGLMLIFGRTPMIHCPECHDLGSGGSSKHKYLRLRWYSWCTFWLFGAIILVNVFATFAESGFHAFLPDNPTSYRLFEE